MSVELTVDGRPVTIAGVGASLLEALREELGMHGPKDGCSPQGQCGCCTVLVDESPRVACVTPVRRVAGRAITTVDGLDPAVAQPLLDSFVAAGASQCGFCTPGILCRLAALGPAPTEAQVEQALLAHLCRCTGWRSVVAAATQPQPAPSRDWAAASRRATLEGGSAQQVGPAVALGRGGFADDTAPPGALVAVPDGVGGWAVGESLAEARAAAGKVQGRRSGQEVRPPIEVPPGEWAVRLQTSWVEPGYLEPDSSWCVPGGQPASPLANGGAFGAKLASPAPAAARRLADKHGRPVRVVLSREDVVLQGGKRPPVAAGARADGTGVMRVARAPGVASAIAMVAPGLVVEEVDVDGPPVSAAIRAAGWAEAAVLLAALGPAPGAGPGRARVVAPSGGWAEATVAVDHAGLPTALEVTMGCGEPLDEVVARSYAVGAAHMALGWVCSEGMAVDAAGVPQDLTIRSWGILRARDTPPVTVQLAPAEGPAVAGSDAVFAAVAAAVWIAQGLPPQWPTRRGSFR